MKKIMSIHRKTPSRRPAFKGPKLTVPRGAMSLQEMLRRYVRREALPVERDGVYADVGYDLEKVSRMDRVDQQEVLNDVRDNVEKLNSEYKAAAAAHAANQASPAPKKKKVVQKDPKDSSPKA